MEPSEILMASLGAIAVLVVLYAYIFAFERRLFLLLWMAGWVIIGLNYSADAFAPEWLRESRLNLLISLGSYYIANVLIVWGSLRFLGKPVRKSYIIAFAWPFLLILFSVLRWTDLQLIQYANLAILLLYACLGVIMMRLTARSGKLVFALGLMNLAWVLNTAVFVYVLPTPQLVPFIVSHMVLLINAAGLVLLFFRQQKKDIEHGLAHIAFLTQCDELTGLHNKAYFDNRIQEFRHSAAVPISVLVGDMNGLKLINDVFGHEAGDAHLKRTGAVIRETCRQNDIIARWGGDEFAVIFPDTDYQTALDISSAIENACRADRETGIPLSISTGVASKDDGAQDLCAILKKAEEIMYEKKLVEGKRAKRDIADALTTPRKNDCGDDMGADSLTSLATSFAGKLELPERERRRLLRAISIHDIEMPGTPEDNIQSQSSMNGPERSGLKKHVGTVYRVANALWDSGHIADILLYHHERWDGQGYPGMKEKEGIPYLSRILAVLDAFIVLSGGPAASIQDALNELAQNAGVQLDPSLVPAFIEMMTENASTEALPMC